MTLGEGTIGIVARVVAVAGAIFLAIVGIIRFTIKVTDAQFYIMAIYFLLFAALLVTAVLQVSYIVKWFGFVEDNVGLGLFLIFLGLLVFDWDNKTELGCCVALLGAGGFNVFIGLKYA